ncbi:hypothetical protein SAMN05216412_10987, partial [Nitrosospira multiformis]
KHRRSKSGNYPYVEVYQFSLATLYQFTFAGDNGKKLRFEWMDVSLR